MSFTNTSAVVQHSGSSPLFWFGFLIGGSLLWRMFCEVFASQTLHTESGVVSDEEYPEEEYEEEYAESGPEEPPRYVACPKCGKLVTPDQLREIACRFPFDFAALEEVYFAYVDLVAHVRMAGFAQVGLVGVERLVAEVALSFEVRVRFEILDDGVGFRFGAQRSGIKNLSTGQPGCYPQACQQGKAQEKICQAAKSWQKRNNPCLLINTQIMF